MKKIYIILTILVLTSLLILARPKTSVAPDPIVVEPTIATTTPVKSPAPKPKSIPTPAPKLEVVEKKYKTVMTTIFWVGEDADESNGFIQNRESYWDSFWMDHFGGVDAGSNRCGFNPCGFIPKENPFYFALPYGDRNDNDEPKESLKQIPWYTGLLKNKWIEVVYGNKTCYAQWEDVGPTETDDFAYVFGSSTPINQFGMKAGLDISPATWDCLGLKDNSLTSWRFVSDSEVPSGPWKQTITTRGISF